MKKTKLIPLTINRAKWARGGINGDASLLNSSGNMCCLGFACRTVGVSAKTMKGHGCPADLPSEVQQPSRLAKKLGKLVRKDEVDYSFQDSDATEDAMAANDNTKISDKMREYRLKPILKKLGFAVKFTGPTRED